MGANAYRCSERNRAQLQIDLTGKVALVTGSGRGIGKAIALSLAASGASIVLNDINPESISEVSAQLSGLGTRNTALQGDVADRAAVERVAKGAIETFGRVDILVNNAGVVVRKPMEDYSEDDWDRVIGTNLKGVFNFSQAIGRTMIPRRSGRIINIASIMGEVALPPRASYVTSKGGIIAFTKNLAAEWAKHNITVNSISPGWTNTEMTGKYFAQEEVRKFLLERVPLGRFAETSDIASLSVYLASDLSGYITGQNIFVDGGWTIQ
jgi:NAD(P)-dependent dehydrogenase (short-subunit alcohol dehydrogenase family)